MLFPVEVRFTAADDIWLSHGYGRDSAYLAVHQYVGDAVRAVLPGLRGGRARLGGRPHWGKLHYRDAGVPAPTAYPRFADFQPSAPASTPAGSSPTPTWTTVLGP